ncbi:Dual specificity protein kinase FUZ7 [Wickerhamiella sorbophila]|uniref:Dual specificity protein kinase FUZ7 n=1 Tax=Wickerhamiella sorbophila TaxID=45607 RepID=A0A2T0FM08_9ASCO|nr:Dual specificity protein kinase FUZ7 [Wickerhamiella sorbophila]PRT56007.1 Dual specificity protein kinase FUZ7 [Wickerhamiella sorbophila]
MMIPTPKTLRRKNFKHLQLDPHAQMPVADAPLSQDSLKPGVEFDVYPLQDELQVVAELGYGNGGTVYKVYHPPTNTYMAKKLINLESNMKVQKAIAQELETLRVCDSDFIVKYYGQIVEPKSVTICMEFMDCGSLDKIYKAIGPFPEDILASVNAAVVDGINYLKDLNITHRDLKPSNILVNSRGEIKLCDFGVSGVLIDSLAETFVGTSTYMSPERIKGSQYTAAGDVWSLGLVLVELALGRFPFASGDNNSVSPLSLFELLQRIVEEPPPSLPANFSDASKQFVQRCLMEAEKRMTPRELRNTSFYIMGKQNPGNLLEWAAKLPRV